MPAKKADNAYKAEEAMKIRLKIQVIQKELPSFVADFTRSMIHNKSELTRLGYVYDLRLFFRYLHDENPIFGAVPLASVTVDMLSTLKLRDFEMYAEYLGQYVKTDADGNEVIDKHGAVVMNTNNAVGTARKLSALRSFFKYLYTHGLIQENVPANLGMPKIHKKAVIYLDKHEIERMFDTVSHGTGLSKHQKAYTESFRTRDIAIVSLLLGTGIRESELIGLDMDHIDLERNSFLITRKGGNESILYFNDVVKEALADYLQVRKEIAPQPGNENALFLSSQRKRISARAVQNLIKKYASIAAPLKKRLSPHKMRSTFATNLYQNTHDIYKVSEVLGHANIETTTRYTSKNDVKEEAAEDVDWIKRK